MLRLTNHPQRSSSRNARELSRLVRVTPMEWFSIIVQPDQIVNHRDRVVRLSLADDAGSALQGSKKIGELRPLREWPVLIYGYASIGWSSRFYGGPWYAARS